jgi:predicted CXXCH cytochrome family protein
MRFAVGILVCLVAVVAGVSLRRDAAVGAEPTTSDPNAACARCHKEIYERYRNTPMARASGQAAAGLIPADLVAAASGVHYRVFAEDGKAWLSYKRDDPARSLDGRQELIYFLGSGKRGRTYLFEKQGYWFELPINWYAKKQIWDMAPNYQTDREMPLTMPVEPGCLHCHFSGAVSSLPDARNHYAAAPFASGGITCAGCHGDGTAHVASGGKTQMMKIDALAPARRDSVCLNCHLEGQAAVRRLGKKPEDFRPGDDLAAFEVFFVHRDENGSGGSATSQWEALLKSQCKAQSGDKLTCTTCHDPHGSPGPSERVAFYRQKCLQCHAGMATGHHAENPDCTECHMGRPPSTDIAHEQVTDHWIKRQASGEPLPRVTTGDLVSVGGVAMSDRDLGLGYAQMAARGDKQAGERALDLPKKAENEDNGATKDHELHAQLGFLEQVSGDSEGAAAEYRAALAADGLDSLAGGNLALIEAQKHQYAEAMQLWKAVFDHDPVQLGAGFNLAVMQCGTGDGKAALATLDRLTEFAPDSGRARAMAEEIRDGKRRCSETGH